MVQKIFDFLYRERGALNQAALLLGFFSFLSQVLAFLRDRFLAHIFGASSELDVYYAAFRIPDFIFVTAASVVSLSVLVPFIIEKESEGAEALKKFIDGVFSFFAVFITAVSLLAYFAIPEVSAILFKGFTEQELESLIYISRIMLLSPIFLGFSNLLGSLTQAYNRFTVYAFAPILYNIGIIAGILLLSEEYRIFGVALGVVAGAAMHSLIQVPFVIASGLFPKPSLKIDWASIKRIAATSMPRTMTLSMTQISFVFLVAMASLMATGSISIFSLSFNLQSVPLIIGVSYSLAAFPTLSRRFQEKNLEAFKEYMAATVRFIIFWSLPLTALFVVLRAQIVRVILGSGLFNWDDTRLTAAAVALFVVSAAFQCLLLLFIRGFYSAGYTKKPFIINLISSVVLVAGAWSLVKLFYLHESFRLFIGALLKVEDISDTGVLMLPLAFTIASIFNGVVHWVYFEKEFKGFSKGIAKSLLHCMGAAVIIGAVSYLGLNIFAPVFDTATLFGIFLQGLCAGLLGIAAGVGILSLLKNRELEEVWKAFKNRFWKTKGVIATDPEIV